MALQTQQLPKPRSSAFYLHLFDILKQWIHPGSILSCQKWSMQSWWPMLTLAGNPSSWQFCMVPKCSSIYLVLSIYLILFWVNFHQNGFPMPGMLRQSCNGWIPITEGEWCGLWYFFDEGPLKLLNKQSDDRWIKITWCSCDVIFMNMAYSFPEERCIYLLW